MDRYHASPITQSITNSTRLSIVRLIIANKIDLTGGREAAEALAEAIGKEVLPVSAVSRIGLPVMVERLWGMIRRAKEEATG